MSDSDSDGAGYLSERNQESGHIGGPQDPVALAASSYTRLPYGASSYRAHMTPKIPPGFDGIMSWFEYEQLVDDWVALTAIQAARQRPALKTRLTGLAEKYKQLLENEQLEEPDTGVEYFKRFLRPYFVKGNQHVYLWRLLRLYKAWRGQKRRGLDERVCDKNSRARNASSCNKTVMHLPPTRASLQMCLGRWDGLACA